MSLRRLLPLLSILASAGTPGAASAASAGATTRLPCAGSRSVSTQAAIAPDGSTWVACPTGSRANSPARLVEVSPAGQITQSLALPKDGAAKGVTGPLQTLVTASGDVWVAEVTVLAHIPAGTAAVQAIKLPSLAATGAKRLPFPKSFFPEDLTAAPDGSVWFDYRGGLGRADASGAVRLYGIGPDFPGAPGVPAGLDAFDPAHPAPLPASAQYVLLGDPAHGRLAYATHNGLFGAALAVFAGPHAMYLGSGILRVFTAQGPVKVAGLKRCPGYERDLFGWADGSAWVFCESGEPSHWRIYRAWPDGHVQLLPARTARTLGGSYDALALTASGDALRLAGTRLLGVAPDGTVRTLLHLPRKTSPIHVLTSGTHAVVLTGQDGKLALTQVAL